MLRIAQNIEKFLDCFPSLDFIGIKQEESFPLVPWLTLFLAIRKDTLETPYA